MKGKSTIVPAGGFLLLAVALLTSAVKGNLAEAAEHGTPAPFKKCWSYKVSETDSISLASDDRYILVSGADAHIVLLSQATGERIWATELGGETVSNIYLGPNSVFIVTQSPAVGTQQPARVLRSLSKETGLTNWSVAESGGGPTLITGEDAKVTILSSSGSVRGYETETGKQLWEREFAQILLGAVWTGGGKISFSTRENGLFILDSSTGRTVFQKKLDRAATSIAVPNEKTIVWGDETGQVISQNIGTGRANWRLKQGGKVSDMRLFEGGVLVSSFDNFVYFVSLGSGNVRWKKRQPGRISRASIFEDHAAVLVGYGENSAALIDLQNGKPINQLSDDSAFVGGPVISKTSLVFATTEGVTAYGQNGCAAAQKPGGE